jgi:hypothetical protein
MQRRGQPRLRRHRGWRPRADLRRIRQGARYLEGFRDPDDLAPGWQRHPGNDGTARVLVPPDALTSPGRDAGIKASALSAEDLKGELLELVRYGRVLARLDACHSGATTARTFAIAELASFYGRDATVGEVLRRMTSVNCPILLVERIAKS